LKNVELIHCTSTAMFIKESEFILSTDFKTPQPATLLLPLPINNKSLKTSSERQNRKLHNISPDNLH
jgi:hypothetical protein